jgi:sulfite reductase (NADPH) flavoprotein alpha-component
MLADRVASGSSVRVFVQPSHGFSVPADPTAAMIMIGPGTGIAPFRAFLHERDATGAPGKNWLFFGDQRSEFDFLYKEELFDFLSRGLLTRLETAFSRDQTRKVYVQDHIVEHGEELYRWINEGAYVYVCGDARRMAADVDRALREVVQVYGRLDAEAAKAYVAQLTSEKRYRRDVY